MIKEIKNYIVDYLWIFIFVLEYKKKNVIVNFLEEFMVKSMLVLYDVYIKLYVKYMLLMNNFMIKVILCNKILLFVFVLYRVIGKLVFCFYFFYGSFICYFNIDNYKLDVN